MARYVLLLRGINVGANKRIRMADLRDWLEADGFEDVGTLLQSGNVVLSGTGAVAEVAARVTKAIHDGSGHDVPVVVRTKAQLTALVDEDPLGDVATDGSKRFVSFLDDPLPAALRTKLEAIELDGGDALELRTKELVLWCPAGALDSPLAKAVAKACGTSVLRTDRNWNTVEKLVAMF